MKGRPIIFNSEMVRAILDGRKTQTRRIVKPQPELMYRISDDNVEVVYNSGELYGFDFPSFESGIAADPGISELGLHGGVGWQYLLTNQIQRLWQKGIRGLVSFTGSRNYKGVLECLVMPREQEGNEVSASTGLYGVPRNADSADSTNQAQRRSALEQRSDKSCLGNASGELGGSSSPRERNEGGKTSYVEIDECGTRAHSLGAIEKSLQSAPHRQDSWNVPSCNIRFSGFWEGLNLWVRETSRCNATSEQPPKNKGRIYVEYKAGGSRGFDYDLSNKLEWFPNDTYTKDCFLKWCPSIHMPRWASRINLEVTEVRVERLQSISEEDAKAEGAKPYRLPVHPAREHLRHVDGFTQLWESINGEGSWDANPFVWVVSFRRIEQ